MLGLLVNEKKEKRINLMSATLVCEVMSGRIFTCLSFPFSASWSLVLLLTLCQFTVGSTCKLAKNRFAFQPELVRETRHDVSAYPETPAPS